MELVSRDCPVCGIVYQANPTRLRHGRQTTCSRECSYKLCIQKMADINIGREPWNKGQFNRTPIPFQSCQQCGKQYSPKDSYDAKTRKFCSKDCAYLGRELKGVFQPGHPVYYRNPGHSDETKLKIALTSRSNVRRGQAHPNWRGGKRTERKEAMGRWEYKEWRSSVFERDNYICQSCGAKDLYLHADHIIDWSVNESLRFELSNGRTLCYRCHYKKTFGSVPEDEEIIKRWGIPSCRGGESNF